MLQKLGEHISNSYTRAAECEDRARQTNEKQPRASQLEMARAWRHIAKSYEYIASLERFLLDVHENGWPFSVEDLPKPPDELSL
jgi:hypothetical protein